MTPEQIEQGRMQMDWTKYDPEEKRTEQPSKAAQNEKWDDISADVVNKMKPNLPLSGDVSGNSVAIVQILLDRARSSPGIIDGRWGKNTENAVYWFQKRVGLPATGQVDQATFSRLVKEAGDPSHLITKTTLSSDDVSGPFVNIPSDVYAKAKMDCMCYESLKEKLSEMFHVTPELLQKLNQDVDISSLKADDSIMATNVDTKNQPPENEKVAKLEISDGGHYVHALDANGNLLAHYPSTLGSDYNPSPTGKFEIDSITKDPTWHYQPKLLGEGNGQDAKIPPGPNNAVGVVWMDLSKEHYGIHGTSAPATIGYVTSHGCVRLTNWDASELADWVSVGTPVHFLDVTNQSGKKESD